MVVWRQEGFHSGCIWLRRLQTQVCFDLLVTTIGLSKGTVHINSSVSLVIHLSAHFGLRVYGFLYICMNKIKFIYLLAIPYPYISLCIYSKYVRNAITILSSFLVKILCIRASINAYNEAFKSDKSICDTQDS